MRVLVYVPLAPTAPKLYPATLDSLLAQEWDGPLDMVLGRVEPPAGDHFHDLAAKHNAARQLALDGGYDALWLVEYDMILPPDALRKLAEVDADIVYGLYVARQQPWLWLYATTLGPAHVRWFVYHPFASEGLAAAQWGQVVDSAGVGMGCTLIRRTALERLSFRVPLEGQADDWALALDAQAAGLTQKHHLGVVCGHIRGDSATVVYPDPFADYAGGRLCYRVEALGD